MPISIVPNSEKEELLRQISEDCKGLAVIDLKLVLKYAQKVQRMPKLLKHAELYSQPLDPSEG
jgi:hypothetical protein